VIASAEGLEDVIGDAIAASGRRAMTDTVSFIMVCVTSL
jgi:hypothetical protein